MSNKADSPKPPAVKYGLSAEDAASDPIVRRHLALAEEESIIRGHVVRASLEKLAELRRAGDI